MFGGFYRRVGDVENQDLFELVDVASGAKSLRSLEYRETFHPVVGPMIEARGLHVIPHRFVERANLSAPAPFVIWDVGLGAAANAIAILESFRDGGAVRTPVELYSFDRSMEALRFALEHAEELRYFVGWEELVRRFLEKGEAEYRGVRWRLVEGDFRERMLEQGNRESIPAPQSVIFDPYSPGSNPELWTVDVFSQLRKRVGDERNELYRPCFLSSYSRSTAVRTTFLIAGWYVGIGSATGEKQETTVVASDLSLLEHPLERNWLKRVAKSHAPGPLRGGEGMPMSGEEVAEVMKQHPQFL